MHLYWKFSPIRVLVQKLQTKEAETEVPMAAEKNSRKQQILQSLASFLIGHNLPQI